MSLEREIIKKKISDRNELEYADSVRISNNKTGAIYRSLST